MGHSMFIYRLHPNDSLVICPVSLIEISSSASMRRRSLSSPSLDTIANTTHHLLRPHTKTTPMIVIRLVASSSKFFLDSKLILSPWNCQVIHAAVDLRLGVSSSMRYSRSEFRY